MVESKRNSWFNVGGKLNLDKKLYYVIPYKYFYFTFCLFLDTLSQKYFFQWRDIAELCICNDLNT